MELRFYIYQNPQRHAGGGAYRTTNQSMTHTSWIFMTTICSPDNKQKTLQSKILTFCITFQHVNSTFYLNRKIKMVNVCKLIPQRQNKLHPRKLINYMYSLIFLSEIICDKSLHIWSRFRTLIHMQSSQLNYKPRHALFKMI